jgi:hypothetical protein
MININQSRFSPPAAVGYGTGNPNQKQLGRSNGYSLDGSLKSDIKNNHPSTARLIIQQGSRTQRDVGVPQLTIPKHSTVSVWSSQRGHSRYPTGNTEFQLYPVQRVPVNSDRNIFIPKGTVLWLRKPTTAGGMAPWKQLIRASEDLVLVPKDAYASAKGSPTQRVKRQADEEKGTFARAGSIIIPDDTDFYTPHETKPCYKLYPKENGVRYTLVPLRPDNEANLSPDVVIIPKNTKVYQKASHERCLSRELPLAPDTDYAVIADVVEEQKTAQSYMRSYESYPHYPQPSRYYRS